MDYTSTFTKALFYGAIIVVAWLIERVTTLVRRKDKK